MFIYYTEPRVIRNFITRGECEYLLNPEIGIYNDSAIGRGLLNKKTRKSKSISFHDVNHPVINDIRSRVSKLTHTPLCKIELIQVSKYETGGFYRPHFDSALPSPHRPYTMLIYLNDDYEGGETYFPKLKKKYKLNRCDALLFSNHDSSGNVADKSMHSGELVTKGEKWICTVWINKNNVELL
jgi:predicted 2-oxoglutarate/Fe(II)-dependent dioxygenase YbiX